MIIPRSAECDVTGLEAMLQSLYDMNEITNTMYISYHAGLCARIGRPCPWETNMRKIGPYWFGGNLIIFIPRFIITGILVDDVYSSKCQARLITSLVVELYLVCVAFVDFCWRSYKYSTIVHTLMANAWFLDHIGVLINALFLNYSLFPDHFIVPRSSWVLDQFVFSGLMLGFSTHIYVCFLYTIIIFVYGPQVRVY